MQFLKLGLLAILFLIQPIVAQAEIIYGITNLNQLVTFDSVNRTTLSSQSITGFSLGGEFLVGIDVRPATGELYGLSSQNNLYKINVSGNSATLVGNIPGLTGNAKALDFNPRVDRIRVVSSGGQNFRVHPDTGGLTTDLVLQFAAGDSNFGDTPRVVSAAYTNSIAGATTTTLLDIDAGNDILTTQSPPDDGILNTVGSLGFNVVDSGGFTGFDISGQTGIAYLVGNNFFGSGGLTANSLYTVNLATGAATLLGPVTGSGLGGSFRDIAVVGPAVIPEPSLIVLGAAGLGIVAWRFRRAK